MESPILSVCINTRNRAGFLRQTLDSIIIQLNELVEVVVIDGASDDDTEPMMRDYVERCATVRYLRSETAIGIDEGYDMAVGCANGLYCWMMTDDDIVIPGAVDRLLKEIKKDYDLILVDIVCYTRDMSRSLRQPLYGQPNDIVFRPIEKSDFWRKCGAGLGYIGSVVIRRSIWIENDRKIYYGSYFIHVGIIMESTAIHSALLMSVPYIRYRSANSSWTPHSFKIWNFIWPNLILNSKRLSDDSKRAVVNRDPWRRVLTVLKSRAMGEYDMNVFHQFLQQRLRRNQRYLFLLIAALPRGLLNLLLLLFCLIFRRSNQYVIYNFIVASPYPRFSRAMSCIMGIKFGQEQKLT